MKAKFHTRDITTFHVLICCKLFHIEGHNSGSSFKRLCDKFPNHPAKVIYAAMDREDTKGFIEWGTSIRGAWVTALGDDFLQQQVIIV